MVGEFYTYMLVDPFTNLPFYVGKGKGNRAYTHLAEAFKKPVRGANMHKINTIKKIVADGGGVRVVIVDSGISEAQAFELEAFAIDLIGRSDLGTGPLTNLTNGGEGLVGLDRDLSGENNPNYGKRGEKAIWWGRKHDEATKKRISESQLGRVFSDEHRASMRKPKSPEGRANIAKARLETSYRPSEETKRKVSEALKGRPSPMRGRKQTDEARAKMSASSRGKPKKKESCPHCGKLCAPNVLYRWHMDNCKEYNNVGS